MGNARRKSPQVQLFAIYHLHVYLDFLVVLITIRALSIAGFMDPELFRRT
jgi:hypothetical protein